MNHKFIGSLVSLDCGDVLGTYQGQVVAVDTELHTISIINAFQNGIASTVPRITLSAGDIHNLRIVKNAIEAQKVVPLVNKHIGLISRDKMCDSVAGLFSAEADRASNEIAAALNISNSMQRLMVGSNGKGVGRCGAFPCNGDYTSCSTDCKNMNSNNNSIIPIYPEKLDSDEIMVHSDLPLSKRTKAITIPSAVHKETSFAHSNGVVDYNQRGAGYLITSPGNKEGRPRSVNEKNGACSQAAVTVVMGNGLKLDNRSKSAGDFNRMSGYDLDGSAGLSSIDFINSCMTASNTNGFNNGLRNRTSSSCDMNHINGFATGSKTSQHGRKAITPRKDKKQQRSQQKQQQMNEDCFATAIDAKIGEDFDFESNLALFDKRAVYDEIERDVDECPAAMGARCAEPKFRCDENILGGTAKAVFRQIKVKANGGSCGTVNEIGSADHDVGFGRRKEFVTDTGLVVPSITKKTKEQLFSVAEQYGFTKERRSEMIGRSTGEMVLQLLGGSNRFNPKNGHQRPVVIVICGSGQQAAVGLNCARQLAGRTVAVTVYLPAAVSHCETLDVERKLFGLTGGVLTCKIGDLNGSPVDMIVTALEDFDATTVATQSWYQTIVRWANENKAPVLAVDPPVDGGGLTAKWCMTSSLPLSFSEQCGQVYLSDLGIPREVYTEVGITYRSPFGHKYVIPLYDT